MAPDLLIAFQTDPEAYREDNGYVISVQGKPPDFVMEIASQRTGRRDVVQKRARYAALGILEYWRFDETGEFHGTRLAGHRLVQGRYETITIETVEDGILQGHSDVLNLYIQGFYCLPANVSPRRRQAEGEETHDRAKRESAPGSGLVFRAPSAP